MRMFEFFGAVPHVIVCDNLKSAVTKASRTEPEVNTTYQHLVNTTAARSSLRVPANQVTKRRPEGGVLLVERVDLVQIAQAPSPVWAS